MNSYEKLIKALEIFNKYDHPGKYVSAEHDELFAGPEASVVSPEDLATLDELGWRPSEYGGFQSFT